MIDGYLYLTNGSTLTKNDTGARMSGDLILETNETNKLSYFIIITGKAHAQKTVKNNDSHENARASTFSDIQQDF